MVAMVEGLIIVGTGEVARLADEYFTHDSPHRVVAFAAERAHLQGDTFEGRPAVPLEELPRRYPPDAFEAFVAVSATQVNRLRSRLFAEVKRQGYRCASYVSSAAHVWRNVPVGENCLIAEGNVVQPFASIGDDVFLHTGNVVGHRTVIEDHCFLSAHVVVAGFCRIGHHTFVGLNATFNDKTGVAPGCIVASGSVVQKHLSLPGRVYHGSPAVALEGVRSEDVAL